jgi:hypothetical protein
MPADMKLLDLGAYVHIYICSYVCMYVCMHVCTYLKASTPQVVALNSMASERYSSFEGMDLGPMSRV